MYTGVLYRFVGQGRLKKIIPRSDNFENARKSQRNLKKKTAIKIASKVWKQTSIRAC